MPPSDLWDHDDILDSFNKAEYPNLAVRHGMTLTHTGSRFTGKVAGFSEGDSVVLVNDAGHKELFRAWDGAFTHDGTRVALRAMGERTGAPPQLTASGSIAPPKARARVAQASRIWVEGIHDAELIEKVWGDDLREAGTVVEPLHGADDLMTAVSTFRPGESRRLGVLLDHLVEGSKESQIAETVTHPHVLICGHPYVDIWEAIRPATIGISAWPEVGPGRPWKEGVLEALGLDAQPGAFWGKVLDAVSSYRDIETPLVNAVEQLIDFVTVS